MTAILVKIKIKIKKDCDIGIFDAKITYTEYKEETYFDVRTENVDLKWEESKMITFEKDEEIQMVEFVSYDGIHYEYPDFPKYLMITFQGNCIYLTCNLPNTKKILVDMDISQININNNISDE